MDNQPFTEESLGDGPHWGIWSDVRLWRLLADLISGRANRIAAMQMEPTAEYSIDTDIHETHQKAFALWLRRLLLAPATIGFMIWLIFANPAGSYFSETQFRGPTVALVVLTIALSALLFFVSLSPPAPMDREYLAALRRKAVLSEFVWAVILASVGCLAILLYVIPDINRLFSNL